MLVVAVQEALEALHEEASPEVGAGERREDVVDLEIVEEERHEVEVAFQAAVELREVVALAEGEARLHELCALSGLRMYKTQVKRGLTSIRRRHGVTDTRARELKVAQLAGKSDPVLKFVLSLHRCLGDPRTCCHAWGCARIFFRALRSLWL